MISSRKHHHEFTVQDSEGNPGTPTAMDLKPPRVLDKLRIAHRQQVALAWLDRQANVPNDVISDKLLQWVLDNMDR